MDELKKISPELSKLKKENPFRTPDKYFDDFSAQLQMKLEAEKKSVPIQQNRIIRFLKPAIALAASFTIIFMLVYWPLKTFVPSEVANNTEILNMNEMEYRNNIEGIDENSFYSLLEEKTTSIEFSDEDLISYVNTNVSEYEIYLATNY